MRCAHDLCIRPIDSVSPFPPQPPVLVRGFGDVRCHCHGNVRSLALSMLPLVDARTGSRCTSSRRSSQKQHGGTGYSDTYVMCMRYILMLSESALILPLVGVLRLSNVCFSELIEEVPSVPELRGRHRWHRFTPQLGYPINVSRKRAPASRTRPTTMVALVSYHLTEHCTES